MEQRRKSVGKKMLWCFVAEIILVSALAAGWIDHDYVTLFVFLAIAVATIFLTFGAYLVTISKTTYINQAHMEALETAFGRTITPEAYPNVVGSAFRVTSKEWNADSAVRNKMEIETGWSCYVYVRKYGHTTVSLTAAAGAAWLKVPHLGTYLDQ
jgi:hypothetical protein